MSYTTPESAVTGNVLTPIFWNTQVRDNISYLYSGITSATATLNLVAGTVTNLSGSAATINTLSLNTAGSVTATQGSVTATQGSVAALAGTAGTAWSITALAGTAGTAVNLTATQGSVVTIANSVTSIAGTISANNQAQPIGTISTNYTLGTADAGKFFTVTANGTITVPANTTAPFVIGQRIDFVQTGGSNTGVVFSAASGTAGTVTLYSTPSSTLRAVYSGASLVKLATNTWALVGDLN